MRVLERLSVRLALAVLSGIGVMLAGEVPGSGWFSTYGLPGAVFAAGVLWPLLRRGNLLVARAISLVVASGVSYWAAVSTGIEVAPWLSEPREPGLRSYVVASLVGAAIVVVFAKWLVPLPTPPRYWVLSTIAAIVGGFVMYFGFPGLPGDASDFASFATWHALLCVALHFGSRARAR